MSDQGPSPSRRKLPPLGQTGSEAGSLDRTPRKKRKPPTSADSHDGEGPRRVLPKPGSARSLTESESNIETARSGRAVPSRPKSKKLTDTTNTLQDIEDEETPRPPKRKRTKVKVSADYHDYAQICNRVTTVTEDFRF